MFNSYLDPGSGQSTYFTCLQKCVHIINAKYDFLSFQVLRHRAPSEGPVPLHHEQGQEDGAPRLAVGAAAGGASSVRAGEEGHLFDQSGFYLSRGERDSPPLLLLLHILA